MEERYTEEEKAEILKALNAKRVAEEHREEMERIRFLDKQVYTFNQRTFYKLKEMEREYFLEVKTCGKIGKLPTKVPLYYRTFGEMKKIEVLVKIDPRSEKILVSKDTLRVYFKAVPIEAKHQART